MTRESDHHPSRIISIEALPEMPAQAVPSLAKTAAAVVHDKLMDALIPGYQAEFDPLEAINAGAFVEDALSEQDAIDSAIDLLDAAVPVSTE